MRFRFAIWCGFSLVLTIPARVGFAQNLPPSLPQSSVRTSPEPDESLGAVARRTKINKGASAKKVITDDDIKATIGPLPRLKMKEAENGEDVIAAIISYKQSHSAEQTEEAVRRWFDEYDKELEEAIQSNIEIKAVRGANVGNAYVLCENDQDYYQCQKRRVAETDGALRSGRNSSQQRMDCPVAALTYEHQKPIAADGASLRLVQGADDK